MEQDVRTELRQIANQLQLGEYPPAMEDIYIAQKQNAAPACDLELIDRLQREHNIFAEFYDTVKETAIAINADPLRSVWVKTAVTYISGVDHDTARMIPAPPADGTVVADYLMLHLLIPLIPGSLAEYRRRGFSEDEVKSVAAHYAGCIRVVRTLTGRPGINLTYYRWLIHFAKSMIFKTNGLQFELKKFPPTAIWLRNKQTKAVVPVMLLGTFHRSGIQRLGSVGYEDEAGAFRVEFSEDDENFYGHGTYEGRVSPTQETFPKAQWESVGRPGEGCLNVHIPRGADISPQVFRAAWDSARKIIRERYPEHGGGDIFAYSWLFDPRLQQLLGKDSGITKFQNMFARFPIRNNGRAVFTFVFPGYGDVLEELPENTSLQRKLKSLYLGGEYIYEYAGAVFGEDE